MKSRLNRAPADLAAEPIEGDSWLAVASGESTSVLDELSGRKATRRMQEPAGRTQARRSHSQHQHTRLTFSQPNPQLRHTSRHSTLRSQPPQQAKHATPHHRRDTSTARPMLRAATLTLTAALLMAAAATAARRDTTSGCEDQRYIQRTSTEQPWHTQCTPKESPEHHHEHNHRTVRSN